MEDNIVSQFSDFFTLMAGMYFVSYSFNAFRSMFIDKINSTVTRINLLLSDKSPSEILKQKVHRNLFFLKIRHKLLERCLSNSAEVIVNEYEKIYLTSGIYCVAMVLFCNIESCGILEIENSFTRIIGNKATEIHEISILFFLPILIYYSALIYIIAKARFLGIKKKFKNLEKRVNNALLVEPAGDKTAPVLRLILFSSIQFIAILSLFTIDIKKIEINSILLVITTISSSLMGVFVVFFHFYATYYYRGTLLYGTNRNINTIQKTMKDKIIEILNKD